MTLFHIFDTFTNFRKKQHGPSYKMTLFHIFDTFQQLHKKSMPSFRIFWFSTLFYLICFIYFWYFQHILTTIVHYSMLLHRYVCILWKKNDTFPHFWHFSYIAEKHAVFYIKWHFPTFLTLFNNFRKKHAIFNNFLIFNTF